MKNVIPNALQFKNDLKLILVAHYMKNVSNSSYFEDDREFFNEFLNVLQKNRNTHVIKNEPSVSEIEDNYFLNLKKRLIFPKLKRIVYIILPGIY